jgi:hypothetical protein
MTQLRQLADEPGGVDMTSMIASPMTAADRCDRCGAQALVRATMTSGAELLFCAHHGREYEAGLRALDADVRWESERSAEPALESTRES